MTTEERRARIEALVDDNPDLDLAELRALLAQAGTDVDEDTLIADLDALGYEVDDPAPPEAVVPAEPADPAEPAPDLVRLDKPTAVAAPPAPPEPAGETPTGETTTDEPTPAGPTPTGAPAAPPPRPVWVLFALLGIGAVLLVITVVLFVGGGGDGDDDRTDATTDPDEAEVAEAGGAPTEPVSDSTVPTETAPEGPGHDPALDVPGTLTDDFERTEIGDFPFLAPWEFLRGYFAITDGQMDVLGTPNDGVVTTAVEIGSSDVRAEVEIARPASRAGLAFRIVDESNMFVWARVPEYGTIVLFQVVDGVATPVTASGYVPEGDGTPVLGINVVGDTVELLHEGAVVATYDQLPGVAGTDLIGLALLSGGEGLPLFDDLRILTP